MSDATLPPELPFEPVQAIGLQDEMESSFLDYAMSVITARALPDVRDGLKPVHRRIIWDMEVQGFRPDRNHVKCARVTGDTMANFHPTATRRSTTPSCAWPSRSRCATR